MKRLLITLLLIISPFIFSKATTIYVEVDATSFFPANFTANLGDTIFWYRIAGYHTTTSTSVPSGAASWNAQLTPTDTTFMYVTTTAGVYQYQCNIHGSMGMVAQFTVTDPLSVSTIQQNKIFRLRSSRVTEYLTIEIPELKEYFLPTVRDLTGRAIRYFDEIAPGTTTLFVGDLKNGIYILELTSGRRTQSYRFIKY